MAEIRYAGYPSVVMYARVEASKPKAPVQQLLWGDRVEILQEANAPQGWTRIRSRGDTGWVRDSQLQHEPILEMTWLDVGQGDATLIVTPDDRKVLVDAGQEDNCRNYLMKWRFKELTEPLTIDCAVVTHFDQDHYKGFLSLYADKKHGRRTVRVTRVVHSGLVERPGEPALGTAVAGAPWPALVDLVPDDTTLDDLLATSHPGQRHALDMLRTARNDASTTQMVAKGSYLPGYDAGSPVSLEVLSPVVDCLPDGRPSLPYFGNDDGKAKNGNSVVLMLRYGDLRVLLGADLNDEAEQRLIDVAGPNAAAVYGADIAKSCHHGSGYYLLDFLRAVRPVATVISSGDEESYSHPRPDALGVIGANSRGERPLIFSTELARSSAEHLKSPLEQKADLEAKIAQAQAPREGETPAQTKARADKFLNDPGRNVAVYGAIQLRSDGSRVVMAFKIEAPKSNDKKWDMYRLEHEFVPALGRKEWTYRP